MPTEMDRRPEGEDLVPEDDAVIGRALRWSLAVLVLAAFTFGAGYIVLRRKAAPEEVKAKVVGAIEGLASARPEMPAVDWTDVTAAAGIDFTHTSGARGEKLLPETMGGGTAFFDQDGDGDQDLLFVNAMDWPWAAASSRSTQAFYRNEGGGRFADRTREVGLDLTLYGMGVAVGDYDGDGDADLFLSALGPDRLLHNDDGSFRDVTDEAGVAGAQDSWGSSAGFFDYDRDGDLDLFVCNYVRWSREIDIELNFTLNGTDRAYGPPNNYEGTHPYLYRNDGDGTFTDVSKQAGVEVLSPLNGKPVGKGLAVTFADVDADGWTDVLVANDTVQNFLYHNQADGTFREIGASSGIGFDGAGNATGAMGIDVAHYRNDGSLAVAIGNFANEMTSFYVAQHGGLMFTDEAAGEGIGSPSRLFLKFGLFFFDYDLDGRLDLLQANGHLEDEIHQVQASQQYRQPAQLFWNQGAEARSCYAEVPRERAGALSQPIVGRGASYADYDGDGDLDVVLAQTGGRATLLRNDQRLGHHWLRVVLEGERSNRHAIGAWVELASGGVEQRRQVMPTRSYLSQVESVVTFGLGSVAAIDSLAVIWPDGSRQVVEPPEPDRTIHIVEGR